MLPTRPRLSHFPTSLECRLLLRPRSRASSELEVERVKTSPTSASRRATPPSSLSRTSGSRRRARKLPRLRPPPQSPRSREESRLPARLYPRPPRKARRPLLALRSERASTKSSSTLPARARLLRRRLPRRALLPLPQLVKSLLRRALVARSSQLCPHPVERNLLRPLIR